METLLYNIYDVFTEEENSWFAKVTLGTFLVLFPLSLIFSIVFFCNCCKKRLYMTACQCVNCLLSFAYFASTLLALLWETGAFDSLLTQQTEALLKAMRPTARAATGATVLVNALLTLVERSTAERPCVRESSCFLVLPVSIAGPAILLALEMLGSEQEGGKVLFWIKATCYIICPLCLLVVSIISRPNHQVLFYPKLIIVINTRQS
jgi:hypothetical protein